MIEDGYTLVPIGYQVALDDEGGRQRLRKLALHYKRRMCRTRRYRRFVRVKGYRIQILVLVVYQKREDPDGRKSIE